MLRVHGWLYPKPVTKAEGPAEEFFSEVPRVGGLGIRGCEQEHGTFNPFPASSFAQCCNVPTWGCVATLKIVLG